MAQRQLQLALVGLTACLVVLAGVLTETRSLGGEGGRGVELVEESGSVLSALEQSMDHSIDNKVTSYLSLPHIASMPLVDLPTQPEDDDEIQREEHTQLDYLIEKQRRLAARRDELMGALRERRDAAAEQVARGMVEREQGMLDRAVDVAQQRLSEGAQQWGRLMAQKMHEATLAKAHAIHAQKVAVLRNRLMDAMVQEQEQPNALVHEIRFSK